MNNLKSVKTELKCDYKGFDFMKKLLVLFCLIIFSLPVFAWDDKAEIESIKFLNDSIHSRTQSIMKTLSKDEVKIDRIKSMYKKDKNSIKTKEINNFCLACIQRNQNLLNSYHNDYFLPAYQIYKKTDAQTDFETWINSAAISEISEFYQFYRFTEINLEDCQRFYNLSK